MRLDDIDRLLERADREADGSYRVVAEQGARRASRSAAFRFHDTRPDDPNDIVPHEHRRELRGYGVFAAWLNHVDAKAINSLDTLVTENGRSFVRHHLHRLRLGARQRRRRAGGLLGRLRVPARAGARRPSRWSASGSTSPTWHTVDRSTKSPIDRPAAARQHATSTPDAWKPRVPNQAFLHARADDKFWAAQKLVALSDATAARGGRHRRVRRRAGRKRSSCRRSPSAATPSAAPI